MRNIKLIVVGLVAAFALTACGSGFQFVKRPTPSGIKGATKVALVSITYDGLLIGSKPFDQYIADKAAKADEKGKDDESAAKWDEWKAAWQREVATEIGDQVKGAGANLTEVAAVNAATEGFVIHVNVEAIEPGFYAVVASRPSMTRARVKVYDATKPGEPLYEFTGVSSHNDFSPGGRIGQDMRDLAYRIGNFLQGEIKGG